MPTLNGSETTRAPAAAASAAVVVGRAVVEDEHVEIGGVLADLADGLRDGPGLVERRDDGEMSAHARRCDVRGPWRHVTRRASGLQRLFARREQLLEPASGGAAVGSTPASAAR